MRFRQSPLEILGAEWATLCNQLTRSIYLVPDVPQEHAAHSSRLHVIDHPLFVWLLPICHDLVPRIELSDGFIAQIEKVRVEEWEMVKRLRCAGHASAGLPSHRVGIVFVFHTDTL